MKNISEELQLNVPFKLFENCLIIKGYTRSIIVDLGRETHYFIPNDLSDILSRFDGKLIQDVIVYFKAINIPTIKEYFKFLLKNEIIFFTNMPSNFPKIDFKKWSEPSKIYQSIIDIENNIDLINQDIFNSLDKLNCKYLELRIYKAVSLDKLNNLLKRTDNLSIISINIYLKFTSLAIENEILNLSNKYPRINTVFVFNAPINKQIGFIGKNSFANIYFITQNIKNCNSCGIIASNYFAENITAVTEAINHNSCLNKKISIDVDGNIKNCPSMIESFGNIRNSSLEDALEKKGFEKYWNITKDKIKGCKDCEFRYICTDCRAYVEDENDMLSKPLKCGYNPYTGIWSEWSKNPLKQKAMRYYGINC